MEIYKTCLFSAEIYLFFFYILLFFSVTEQVIAWTYATSLYATLIQFTIVPNYLFFFCVEMFTRVSERQEPNDFNEHKMMMMTAKWDNKVCRNLDF